MLPSTHPGMDEIFVWLGVAGVPCAQIRSPTLAVPQRRMGNLASCLSCGGALAGP